MEAELINGVRCHIEWWRAWPEGIPFLLYKSTDKKADEPFSADSSSLRGQSAFPILLYHGFTGNKEIWVRTAMELVKGATKG